MTVHFVDTEKRNIFTAIKIFLFLFNSAEASLISFMTSLENKHSNFIFLVLQYSLHTSFLMSLFNIKYAN